MRQRDKQAPQSAEEAVRDIRRATRRHFSVRALVDAGQRDFETLKAAVLGSVNASASGP